MARTKKTVSEDTLSAYDDERLVSKFDKRDLKAKVTKGSHLTVTRYSDNRVNLEWDWDALLREVQAISPTKIDIIKETEAKVTKSRSKTATKKPAAKTTKKKETK